DLKEITNRHKITQHKAVALIDEQLQHQFQRRPLPLQQCREGHQRLDQGRTKGIDLPNHVPDARAREQDIEHFVAYLSGLVNCFLELPGRCGGLWTQQAFFYNHGEIPVFERDRVKTRLPPVEDIGKTQLLCARQVVTNQLTQVALTRNETDNGNG